MQLSNDVYWRGSRAFAAFIFKREESRHSYLDLLTT